MSRETHEPAEVAITSAELATRVQELGRELAEALDPDRVPIFVGVLKGSLLFLADLVRAFGRDAELDFISISSYGGASSSGVVRILKDLDAPVAGRDVVLVEDIVDTGLTLTYLRRTLLQREVRSLRSVALLDKAVRRIVPVPVEHVGFEIPDVFVVGYGLDFQGIYRNVADILAVRDIARLANEPRLLVAELFGD